MSWLFALVGCPRCHSLLYKCVVQMHNSNEVKGKATCQFCGQYLGIDGEIKIEIIKKKMKTKRSKGWGRKLNTNLLVGTE